MLRMIAALSVLCCSTFAAAQIIKRDTSLQEQLVPDSFQFKGSAAARKINTFEWVTSISYTITNKSGLNLYMGVAMGSVSIGTCTRANRANGGLQFIPPPGRGTYSIDIQRGPGRGVFVPAGGSVTGTILVDECSAPNPGSAKAPVTMSLMIGKSPERRCMIQVSVSANVPVRQISQ